MSVSIPPLEQAKLTIGLLRAPGTAYLGENFTVTIKVGNKGPDVAKDVIINIPIPKAFQFVTATVDQGTWSYDESTRILTWNMGNVLVGDPYLYLTLKPIKIGTHLVNRLLTSDNLNPEINSNTTLMAINVIERGSQNGNSSNQINGQTIPMQKTGAHLTLLVLSLLAIIGGFASKVNKGK